MQVYWLKTILATLIVSANVLLGLLFGVAAFAIGCFAAFCFFCLVVVIVADDIASKRGT